MTRRQLLLVSAGQLVFLLVFGVWHWVQVATGLPIRLRVGLPVDPVSITRGRYIALWFPASRVSRSLAKDADIKENDVVYVALSPTGGEWVPSGISLKPPEEEVFLKGRVAWLSPDAITVTYGIEHYFLSEESADAIEKTLSGRRDLAWEAREEARREFMRTHLSSEEYRIYSLLESEHLNPEVILREITYWKEKGILTDRQADRLTHAYRSAWEKISALRPEAEKAANEAASSSPDTTVEAKVSVSRSGRPYLTGLIINGCEYR